MSKREGPLHPLRKPIGKIRKRSKRNNGNGKKDSILCGSCNKEPHCNTFACTEDRRAIYLCHDCMKADEGSKFLCDICGKDLEGFSKGCSLGMTRSRGRDFAKHRHLVCLKCWGDWEEAGYH